jgi:hypothetical protein
MLNFFWHSAEWLDLEKSYTQLGITCYDIKLDIG